MTFKFYLPESGTRKNIHLKFTDNHLNETFAFRTSLRIKEENWSKEKQRPVNIYLKKYKKLNAKLDEIKKSIAEYVREQRLIKKQIRQRTISKIIREICYGKRVEFCDNSLPYYMKWYITVKKELICNSTYKRYKVFFHLLERF